MIIEVTFYTKKQLKSYLKEKQYDFVSPEEFHKWLFEFFENGNTVTVLGEEIDYQYCTELI